MKSRVGPLSDRLLAVDIIGFAIDVSARELCKTARDPCAAIVTRTTF